jgi:hypothetical protein
MRPRALSVYKEFHNEKCYQQCKVADQYVVLSPLTGQYAFDIIRDVITILMVDVLGD